MRDGGSSPAIGVQAQVANHRKRLELKALVVSVTEKASEKVSGVNQRRRTTVNHRSRFHSSGMPMMGFVTVGAKPKLRGFV